MNDTDVISRKDVLNMAYLSVFVDNDGHEVDEPRYVIDATDFERLPPIEQPMSAVEYERISRRFSDWCASTLCSECSFFNDCPQTDPGVLRELTPEQYVAAIQKWAREHPEEK